MTLGHCAGVFVPIPHKSDDTEHECKTVVFTHAFKFVYLEMRLKNGNGAEREERQCQAQKRDLYVCVLPAFSFPPLMSLTL